MSAGQVLSDHPFVQFEKTHERSWSWILFYGIVSFSLLSIAPDADGIVSVIFLWCFFGLTTICFITLALPGIMPKDRLILSPEGASARFMGITYTRPWEDIDNFRIESLFCDTMIYCDILRPLGPIDRLLLWMSGWRGAIPTDYDDVDPEALLARVQAMKARYG